MCVCVISDQLCVSELQGRRRSSSGEEKVCEELRQREFCQDRTESEPDRDIELELSVLDMEDRATHNDKSEVRGEERRGGEQREEERRGEERGGREEEEVVG